MRARRNLEVQIASRVRGIPEEKQFRIWLKAALSSLAADVTLTLRVVNAAEARNLNSAFRGKDYATNVLTFVYHDAGASILAGDVVLCAPIVAREAREQKKSIQAHYAHLTIHGALHLAGMDHESAGEAMVMEAREIDLLGQLGFSNPYS